MEDAPSDGALASAPSAAMQPLAGAPEGHADPGAARGQTQGQAQADAPTRAAATEELDSRLSDSEAIALRELYAQGHAADLMGDFGLSKPFLPHVLFRRAAKQEKANKPLDPAVKARRAEHEKARMRDSDADDMLRRAGLASSVAAQLKDPFAPKAPHGIEGLARATETVRPEGKTKPTLSAQQRRTLGMALAGRNVFITGSAGVGKSLLVDSIVEQLKAARKTVAITASTGIAAVNIAGCTVHAFAGIGLGEAPKEFLAKQVAKNKFKRKKWQQTHVLVIDEISMVSAPLLEKLSYVGRYCRGPSSGKEDKIQEHHLHPEPFGGIQIIAVGDFFQLPPVEKSGRPVAFAFEAAVWRQCNFINCVLQKVFRQSDREFIGVLEELRHGRIDRSTLDILRRCNRPLDESDGIRPTLLFPHRASVQNQNESEFRKLQTPKETYKAHEGGKETIRWMLKDCQALPKQELKVGAQVVLLTNLDLNSRLANGSRGVVVDFMSIDEWENNEQGATKSVQAKNAMAEWVAAHNFVPVVRFARGVQRTIGPHVWEKNAGAGEVVARAQIPLAFAWALTVHKCQGMSLDRVQVALADAFAEGMVYVALSRARQLDGLHIESFNPNAVQANPKVKHFYEALLKTNIGEEVVEDADAKEHAAKAGGALVSAHTASPPLAAAPSAPPSAAPSAACTPTQRYSLGPGDGGAMGSGSPQPLPSVSQQRQLEAQRRWTDAVASMRASAAAHASLLLAEGGVDPIDVTTPSASSAIREALMQATQAGCSEVFERAAKRRRGLSPQLPNRNGAAGAAAFGQQPPMRHDAIGSGSQAAPIVLSESP